MADFTSRSSNSDFSIPLDALTPGIVRLVDEIVGRARVDATFLAISEVYKAVLTEHDLDEEDKEALEVWSLLLKVTMVKSPSWEEKWRIVKRRYGIAQEGDDDSGTETPRSGTPTKDMQKSYNVRSARLFDIGQGGTPTAVEPAGWKAFQTRYDRASGLATPRSITSTLPSYNTAAKRDDPVIATSTPKRFLSRLPIQTPKGLPISPRIRTVWPQPASVTSTSHVEAPDGKSPANVAAEGDAYDTWKLLKMERDADLFRGTVALQNSFQRWRYILGQSLSNHVEIARAHDRLLLRNHFNKWQHKIVVRQQLALRAESVDRARQLMDVLRTWEDKLQLKRRRIWQESMRQRLLTVRLGIQHRIFRESWEKWVESWQHRQADRIYQWNLLQRVAWAWMDRLSYQKELLSRAKLLATHKDHQVYRHVLETWRRSKRLAVLERRFNRKRSMSLLANAFELWQRNAQDAAVAEKFFDDSALQRALKKWKHKLHANKVRTRRARQFADICDKAQALSFLKTWVSAERCLLSLRVKERRTISSVLTVWGSKLEDIHSLQVQAIRFDLNSQYNQVAKVFILWRQRLQSHVNAHEFSVRQYDQDLTRLMMRKWRSGLHWSLAAQRQARGVRQLSLQASVWQTWRISLFRKRRVQWFAKVQQSRLRQAFDYWLEVTQRERTNTLYVQALQTHNNLRRKKMALDRWVARVVEIRSREFRAIEDVRERLLRITMYKWNYLFKRQQDNIKLMESFLDVRQEDHLRKVLLYWASAARKARSRRRRLERKEEEARQLTLCLMWETWRDRFKEIQLRDAENEVLIRSQIHTLRRAFSIWKRNSQFLPAVHFARTQVRAHVWRVWRAALPNARRERQALAFERQVSLHTSLQKWKAAYKTAIAKKAVARARAMRTSRITPPGLPLAVAPRLSSSKPVRRNSTVSDDEDHTSPSRAPTRATKALTEHPIRRSLLNSTPDSEASAPARSSSELKLNDTPRSRDRLWKEVLRARSEGKKT